MDIFRCAIEFNNEGARLLENGNFNAARKAFRQATDLMTMVIQSFPGGKMTIKPLPSGKRKRLSTFVWSKNPMPVPLDPLNHETVSNAFFFRRALFIFPMEDDWESRFNASDCTEESATVVYNLALAFHLSSITDNVSEMMKQAKTLYEIAVTIRSRTLEQSCLDIFGMAVLNNLGQIYHELSDYTAAKSLFYRLSIQLAMLQAHDMVHWIAKEDCDGFVLNAMLGPPDLAAAA